MKIENPLDKHLAINTRMPQHLRSAVCDVADLLDLAWITTQSVFEEQATPELAVAVFDRLVSRVHGQWSLDSLPQAQG